MEKVIQRCGAVVLTSAVIACVALAQRPAAPQKSATAPKTASIQSCCGLQKQSAFSKKQSVKFAARADALMGTGPTGKGEWGLLIADAQTGETLYQQNADRYFVPASN